MTTHDILLTRAQACVDHDAATIALCDSAIAGSADARSALVRQSAGRRVGRATVIRTGQARPRTATAQRTQQVPYATLASEADAWSAELRARNEAR